MTSVAVISDIHSNLSALRAVLSDIHQHKPDRIICLGDLVGYFTEPVPVIHLVLARCDVVIKGNHDVIAALGEIPTHYNLTSHQPLEFAKDLLTIRERKILQDLPTMHTEMIGNKKIMAIHGGPEYPYDQYIYPDDEEDIKSTFKYMELLQIDIIFLGHTHIPMQISNGDYMICNPGSVGQPRDGDPRATYLIYNSVDSNVEFYRVSYDPTPTIAGIKKHKFPIELAERLLIGK